MRKLEVILAISCCIGAAASSSARSNDTPQASPPAAQPPVEITGQRLCPAEPTIGTRVPARRKCLTPAETQELQRQARNTIEAERRRPCVAGTGGGENDQVVGC